MDLKASASGPVPCTSLEAAWLGLSWGVCGSVVEWLGQACSDGPWSLFPVRDPWLETCREPLPATVHRASEQLPWAVGDGAGSQRAQKEQIKIKQAPHHGGRVHGTRPE